MTFGQKVALGLAFGFMGIAVIQASHKRDPVPALAIASAALMWAVW